jgi:hypothetical protein
MHASALLEYTGTLTKPAEVRSRIIDTAGHTVPVVCVELEMDNPERTRIHAEQRFDAGQHIQAEHAAKRYTKGERITLHCPIADMSLFAGNTTHIHIHPHTDPSCPTTNCAK